MPAATPLKRDQSAAGSSPADAILVVDVRIVPGYDAATANRILGSPRAGA